MISEVLPELNGAAVAATEEESILPVSFAQRSLWLRDQLVPNSITYNIPIPIRLEGELNVSALQNAFQSMVARHEPFRTKFRVVDSEPMQVIATSAIFQMPVIDLSEMPADEQEKNAIRLTDEDAKKPFHLAKDSLLRAKLIRLSDTEHILLISMHHIVSDGWSIGVFFRDLAAFYENFSDGKPVSLPELPIQYADFASWQREWMQGDVLQKQIDFWKTQLTGAPALLEFPLDHPRPAVQTNRGGLVHFSIDKSVADSLRKLSQKEGCTLFMTLLAAFQTLAARCTGQQDIVIGSPIANRNRADIENLIGYFVNTLLFRTDFSGEPTFREILSRVRRTSLDAYAHQDLPFELLIEKLRPERTQSYSPLFQVMFVLQNTPSPLATSGGLRWTFLEAETGAAKFDLSLVMVETDSGLNGIFEFATDLFEPATIERMAEHFKVLLEGIVAHPEEKISKLPLLLKAERQQLLVEWNETQIPYSKNACVHQLVEAQAVRTPDAVAVRFEKQSLTYRQLNERANQLAHHLQSLGVAPEMLVAICVKRSLEMLVGVLAILKAGAGYVPLDPNYPKDRLAFVLQDSKAPVLLTQKSLLDGLPRVVASDDSLIRNPTVICLDPGHLPLEREGTANPSSSVTGENLAYVIYTSGSTGKPKGVAIEHRNAVAFMEWAKTVYSARDLDGVLFSTSICFDLSIFELFATLSLGGKVILAENALSLATLPAAQEVVLLNTVPSAMAELLRMKAIPSSVRIVNLAGEPLSQKLVEELYENSSIEKVYDLYGPTEDTTYSTFTLRKKGGRETIGRPIANTQAYVLDAQMQPVPLGVSGELHLGGAGLARGYWQRPELTAEKFIPNPFSHEPGARLYKTGDRVRYLPDKNIEYLGRLDHQVKIRGFRIELGEIQTLLGEHPGVREAVVVAREDNPDDKRLVAYFAVEKNQAPTVDALRAFLKTKLPEYMVPTAFVTLEKFPLTPNGKIDRNALPAPETNRPEKTLLAPRDPLEMQLVKLWEKIFSVEPIGVRDNFFELGGHSLLAVRLFAEIEKATGKSLPMVTLFEAPTIEALAKILHLQGWEAPWSSLVPIKASGSKPPFYCVHGVGGNILEYLDLAKYMDEDQPFYGLQAVGLDGKRPWLETVEEMAAHYINEIQSFQPRGPYYIGGSSFGGLVAFEMAHQFQMEGEQVALLAFFDTHAPGHPKFLPAASMWRTKLNRWKFRLSLHGGNIMAAEGADKALYVWKKIKKWSNGQFVTLQRRKRELRQRVEEFFWPKAILKTKKAGLIAHTSYESKKYFGPATLFRATVQLDGIEEHRALGWTEYIDGDLEIYDTPGHHGSIVRDPRAKILSAQLQESLRKAQTVKQFSEPKPIDLSTAPSIPEDREMARSF